MQNRKQLPRAPKSKRSPPASKAVINELEKLLLRRAKAGPNPAQKRRNGKPKNSNPTNTAHPLYKTVKGLLSPFTAERGSFGGLMDPRPSQKFTGRGLLSVQIPANEDYMVMLAPCILSDNLYPSIVLTQGTSANMGLAASTFTSATAANWPAGLTQRYAGTATPYNLSTLQTGQNTFRLLSAGIRVRYTGPQLYRGGLVKYFHDSRGDILNYPAPSSDLTTLTFGTLAERLDGHNGIIRHNLSDSPELQAVFPSITTESQSWTGNQPYYWPGNREWQNQRFGGTTSAYLMGQPIAYLYGSNTTGQALYFDCELVEHWEICGRNVDALNTPSAGNAELGNSLSTLVVASHQHLAHNPSHSFSGALKSAIRDPHVKAAFSGVASNLVSSVVAML
jgi:hypothetical protein